LYAGTLHRKAESGYKPSCLVCKHEEEDMAGVREVRRPLAAAMVTALMLAGAASMLGACNTMAGAGQDISATGHAITGGAEKTKQAMPPNQ
jgi:entericidin B